MDFTLTSGGGLRHTYNQGYQATYKMTTCCGNHLQRYSEAAGIDHSKSDRWNETYQRLMMEGNSQSPSHESQNCWCLFMRAIVTVCPRRDPKPSVNLSIGSRLSSPACAPHADKENACAKNEPSIFIFVPGQSAHQEVYQSGIRGAVKAVAGSS
ncbi:hypothetical protein M378DRAFT_164563 [Amanita muscaria Koide BX008]|uniref:Uncharacterized protein n=1 Tax=Amanita muscaria (strain Koide BX008) TaxID=946122 RepID=A0A0C2X409_AMAMK|nr:hypothetical protein M378DRAFT_164563 [Amanita muscaria Koide BX008]